MVLAAKERSRDKRRLGGPPPRIAFLVDWLEDPYQWAVLTGAVREAERRGASVVALSGGILGGPSKNGKQRNALFQLVQPGSFDAAIVMTGTLGNHLGPEAVAELCKGFRGMPVCSIAVALEGHSSVLVDNMAGMRQGVEHLVKDHHYRRIAFIRGPDVNAEAEARFTAYLEVLEAHGIERDEQLILPGDFQREGGSRAMRSLFDERRVQPDSLDAVVGATDLMVMGALDELGSRGIRVPNDVAVLGFDDVEEARYLSPPLASVRQPLEAQGAEAVRMMVNQLNGLEQRKDRVLSTQFVARRSCGCLLHDATAISERPDATSRLSLEASLVHQRDLFIAELTRAARGSFVGVERDWEGRLFRALLDEFKAVESGAQDREERFRNTFDRLLVQVLEGGGDVSAGNAVVTAMRRRLSICAGNDPVKLRQVERLMHDARILTSALVERSQARARLQMERWARLLADVSAHLATASNREALCHEIAIQLPRLGIDLCLVARQDPDAMDQAKLEAAFHGRTTSGALQEHQKPSVFLAAELAPAAILDRDESRHLVVAPLESEGRYLGYAVFGYAPIEGYAYEVVRDLLSASFARVW